MPRCRNGTTGRCFQNPCFVTARLLGSLSPQAKRAPYDKRHPATAQVADDEQPKVEVAILPEQLGDCRAARVIHKVHAINAAQKLSWTKDGGDQSENLSCMTGALFIAKLGLSALRRCWGAHEEDVVQAICLLGSQQLLIPQQLVLLLLSQAIVHLLDALVYVSPLEPSRFNGGLGQKATTNMRERESDRERERARADEKVSVTHLKVDHPR